MKDFVAINNEIEYEDGADPDDENNQDSTINHIRIRNQLNAELDELSSSDNNNENEEEKEMELIDGDEETPNGDKVDDEIAKEQQLLKELTSSKSGGNKKPKRYFDLLSDANNKGIMLDDDSEDSSSSDLETDQEYEDSSDDSEEDEDDDIMIVDGDDDDDENENKDKDKDKDGLSELSKLEFEKLLSHTICNLALKLEENENENMKEMNNPFANMDDEISLESNNQLNMKDLLSFIDDDIFGENKEDRTKLEDEDMDINDPKNFESVIPFEKSHNILPEPKTSSANHPSNLRKSKLNNVTLSTSQNAAKNTFIQEEERLAEKLSIYQKL